MCYMTATHEAEGPRRRRRPNRRVGVREMRQNLSVYLDRVKAGETLHVTEYGQVVALLRPAPMLLRAAVRSRVMLRDTLYGFIWASCHALVRGVRSGSTNTRTRLSKGVAADVF